MQTFKLRKKIDPSIPAVGLGLTLVGLVMILSSSQIIAADNYGNPYYFFTKQLVAWGIGMVVFLACWKMPVERLYNMRMTFLWLALGMLVLVFIPGIGVEINGSHRWIGIAGHRLFQPTELVKISLVIYLSAWLAAKGSEIKTFKQGTWPFIIILAVVSALILLEPDTDTVVAIVVMALSVFYVAKANVWHIFAIGLAAVGVILFLILNTGYRADRLNTATSKTTDLLGKGYHSQQALIAIGSGGWWGVGFGQGISKYNYLPEMYSDSIFAVMAEELGFVRVSLILLAFLYLIWRGYLLSLRANSRFVQLLAVGITTLTLFQAMINIGGMLGVIPLSGITLPFLSYGGTSLIVNMAMLGLLTNISREVV